MVDAGLIVLCSFISPFAADRAMVRERLAGSPFFEIFVDAPLELCERRDPKGLYAMTARRANRNFTGVDSGYEPPVSPDIRLDTGRFDAEELVDDVMKMLAQRGMAI